MRAFYTTTNKSCALKSDNFSTEERQHKWVETNLQLLFPNLELIESKPRISSKIPDTIAYDYSANTFVAIEYKNRRSDTVREQAEDYLIKMENNHGELASRYNDRPNVKHKTSDSFDWRKMYVVIIAPEFTKRQVVVANHRDTECLYELKRFENGFVTLRFVGGKHAPIDIAEQPKGTTGDVVRELKRPNTGGDTRVSDHEVGGAHKRTVAITSIPSSGAETARTQAAAHASGPGASSPQTEHLYNTIRARLLDEFSGAEEHKKKFYHGFRYPGGKYFCTIAMHKSKIGLSYSGKRAASELKPDDFVRNVNGWGIGKLRSEIKNEDDFEKALVILKRLHDGHKRPDTPVTITREPPSPPQMISIKEWKVQRGVKPTHVAFPGKPIIEVGSWIDVHAEAIEWLIDAGKIDKYGQVATKSGWILYTSDEAYTKKQLRTRKTRYGWFDCNRNVENHIADIAKIFEHAGVDMDFKIAIRPKET